MCKISLNDNFFAPRQKKNIKSTIPSSLKRCEETGRIDAFKLQWKPGSDLPLPHIYWDSDVAKVMEGMAYVANEAPEIADQLEKLVKLVVSAQQPDGYLNTHFSVTEKDMRWKNLFYNHELYCAGHLTEAAVAHYRATGSRVFLDAMCRYCDYICDVFGENGNHGYPGHQELEIALVKLYKVTGNEKYLRQAKLFITRRGSEPNYFAENENIPRRELLACQAHQPLAEQSAAVGHAVRVLYLCSAMADIAELTEDKEMLALCERFFDDITQNKMFITGGVGSRQLGEYVGGTGDQVSERSYAESCAAIALVLFSSRMLKITGQIKYAEIMERTLYNGAISGLSLTGDRFFYANLLACHRGMEPRGHVDLERMPWYEVSCCPTSYCRFLPQIGNFCYRTSDDMLAIDIPAAAKIELPQGCVEVVSGYPYDGNVTVNIVKGGKFTLKVRIPQWCKKVSDMPQTGIVTGNYWELTKEFTDGESFNFNFDMQTVPFFSTVPSLSSQAALCRGPLVYCVEMPFTSEVSPFELILNQECRFETVAVPDLPEGCLGIKFTALRLTKPETLYSDTPGKLENISVTAIPYAFWQNREKSEMTVFMPFYHK
ncbi:MAG: glycoside hydrolase family 127 protein [Lentisphaerae bacterium]|nr:glycoside hydrolase family 127 protein [Lentisphaerota bacterium]